VSVCCSERCAAVLMYYCPLYNATAASVACGLHACTKHCATVTMPMMSTGTYHTHYTMRIYCMCTAHTAYTSVSLAKQCLCRADCVLECMQPSSHLRQRCAVWSVCSAVTAAVLCASLYCCAARVSCSIATLVHYKMLIVCYCCNAVRVATCRRQSAILHHVL
jgi:hypothetical protein